MPDLPGPAITRRAALATTGVGLLATGCGASSRTVDAADPAAETPNDPDQDVVDAAALLVATALLSARATVRRHPVLAPRVRPFVALHRAHAEALPETTEPLDAGTVDAGPRVAESAFVADERDVAERLARFAVDARSGPLARLLASMSAGVSAQLAAGWGEVGPR